MKSTVLSSAQSLSLEWEEEGGNLWRNITFQFMTRSKQTPGGPRYRYWMISKVTAGYQVEQDSSPSLLMMTEEDNPFSVTAPLNSSYSCQEPRSATVTTFLLNSTFSRRLSSAVITMKWVNIKKRNNGQENISRCPQHGRDFIPRVVGLSLVGVIIAVLILYFIGRKTVQSRQGNYVSM